MVVIKNGQYLDVTIEYTTEIDWAKCSAKRFHQAMARFARSGRNLRWAF